MVAGLCKKARVAQDCQEEKKSRCQTDSTKTTNITITANKQLTIAGRNTADLLCSPGGGRFFFAKKNPPGVNSKVGGASLKNIYIYIYIYIPGITQRFYAHFGQIGGGENSEDITV